MGKRTAKEHNRAYTKGQATYFFRLKQTLSTPAFQKGWKELETLAEVERQAGRLLLESQDALEVLRRDAQPTTTRELLMRRFAEAWLEGQRKDWTLTRNPSKPPGDRRECP